MAILYTGALAPKKKSELQAIADALEIDNTGTKDELQTRIKKHLDTHQDLEDDPVFAGLYGRRKRSVPPPSRVVTTPKSPSRKVGLLAPIGESTPVADKSSISVSRFLKGTPFSLGTPSSLPPLPDSPDETMELVGDRSIIDHLPRPNVSNAVAKFVPSDDSVARMNGMQLSFREFCSDSTNIWSLTAIFELLVILSTIVPFKHYELVLAGNKYTLPYPPAYTLQYPGFISTLLHWAIPSVILPALAAWVISFSPAVPTATRSRIPFDPLTASIVRLALQFAYNPVAAASGSGPVYTQDVLGVQTRVLNASIGVAFAFAEAIKGAPAVWAKEMLVKNESVEEVDEA
ncbi:SAP domain-containing protein [Mycena kentingensis (nom. inval.)]|nr:SAP domain-containing protein [Mycena kentingensis (nom. inval.)]